MSANLLCPACGAKRLHTPSDWRKYHPKAGHGYYAGQGWSDPTLNPLYEKEGYLEREKEASVQLGVSPR